MKKKVAAAALVSLAVLSGSWYFFFRGKEGAKVQTVPVTRGSMVRSVSATGSIQAVNTVNIGTQVSGTVRVIHADFNEVVKKGQLLAEIDPALLEANARQAEAGLRSARASLAEAKAGLDDASRSLARNMELFSRGYIAESELDSSRTAFSSAGARVETSAASVIQAEADLQYRRINLGHTRIVSPIDGVVIDRAVDQGQTVNASQSAPTMFTIAEDLSRMQVEAAIDEADIGLIAKGQKARFNVDAFPEMNFDGMVREIRLAPSSTNNVVSYTVIMGVDNDELRLMPGMTANVTVIVESREDVLKVASSALRFRPSGALQGSGNSGVPRNGGGQGKGSAIWTFEKGELVRHEVRTGIFDGMYTEISGDVEEGMEAVTAIETGGSGSGGGAAFGIAPRR
jgi:HlyD family secretion protein